MDEVEELSDEMATAGEYSVYTTEHHYPRDDIQDDKGQEIRPMEPREK